MTKEQAQKLQPFDVVIYKEKFAGDRVYNKDVLVKRVTENGVFCLDKIQSTAALYKFEDLESQSY
jgi:hypothetical protein